MLQSLKRAWQLEPANPHLHDCLLRFRLWLAAAENLHPHVAHVIQVQTEPMVRGRSELQLAEEFINSATTQVAALCGARALRRLDPKRTADALERATKLDYSDLTIQGCVEVLESLREGDFGDCEKEIEQYIEACRVKFSYAIAFKPPAPETEIHVEETALQTKEIAVNN